MRRPVVSLLIGIALGVLYFMAIHPMLVGANYRLILERESALALLFRGLPLLAAAISLCVALFTSCSRQQTFCEAAVMAVGCLLPLPLGQYVVQAPRVFGMPRTSSAMLGDEAVALVGLLVAAAAISGIAAIVAPALSKALGRSLHQRRT